MRPFVSRCLSLAIISIWLSCETPTPDVLPNRIQGLAQTVLSSEQFKNLNLDAATFNLSDARFVTSDQKSISIPVYQRDDRSGLVAIFNDDQSLKKVMFFDVTVQSQTTDIYSDLKGGKFDGTFFFKFEEGAIALNVENSIVLQTKISTTKMAEKCAYWASEGPGGAFDCAGSRLVDMNWYEKALCYQSFVICMANNVISCAIDGCTK